MTRTTLSILASLTGLALSTPASAGGPTYALSADALDPQACGGNGCFTNHLRVTDVDGDGDLDIILANYADFFAGADAPEPLVVYINDGSGGFTNNSTAAVGDFEGNLRHIAVGDVDGDGSVDIYGPSGTGSAHVLFMNDGSGVFTNEADTRLPSRDYPAGAATRMGDVDNDGDLDIFSADGYASATPPVGHLYINDGLGMFTEADASALPDAISGSDIDDVEFIDVDRDFDLDLMVNAHTGGIGGLWLNDGTGNFADGGTLAPPATTNFHYNAAPCDVDGDGDLDLWVDNIGGSFTEQLQINDGAGNFTDETAARVMGNPGADDNGIVCADIDNDGDLDGVVLSLQTPERFLENDGSGNFTYVAGVFPGGVDCTLWGEFGDLNGDARLDLVTGQGECSFSDEVYLAEESVPTDSVAPVLANVENPGTVPAGTAGIVRFSVSDSTVTDEGPRLNRAWAIVDPDGAATEVDATFMGGDIYRAELPAADEGSVSYQVCATDRNDNMGCSETQTYDIGDEPPPGTDSGDDDPSGDGPSVDTTQGGNDDTNPPATGSGGTAGGTETDTADADDSGDDGCGCQQTPAPNAFGLMLLGLLGLGLRRRR